MTLLPPNASVELRAQENILEQQIIKLQNIDLDFNPLTCKTELLPHLAYMYSLDISELRENHARKFISNMYALNKYKGTKWAMLEMLKSIGLNIPNHEAVIIEYKNRNNYKHNIQRDGSNFFNGIAKHNNGIKIYDFRHWSEYAVIIEVSMTNAKSVLAKKLLEIFAPTRSTLVGFTAILQQRDGSLNYDATHKH